MLLNHSIMFKIFFVQYSRRLDIYIGSIFGPNEYVFTIMVYESEFIYLQSGVGRNQHKACSKVKVDTLHRLIVQC